MRVTIKSGLEEKTRQKLATVVNFLNTGRYNSILKVQKLLMDYNLEFEREHTVFYIKKRFECLRFKNIAKIWIN